VYEESFYNDDIQAVSKATEIIGAFNMQMACLMTQVPGKKMICLTQPTVWKQDTPDARGRIRKILLEPLLEGDFIKFNSNSGYTNGAENMQALSHFSSHYSSGQYLLCDLQGGHYFDCYILTDPVVMSANNSKQFGSGDLGKEGIDNFFAHHRCNRFCQGHWNKPVRPRASSRIPCSQGTSLSLTSNWCNE